MVGQSIGHGLFRSVDPDDVQVAVVDTLLVLIREARAAPRSVVCRHPLFLLVPRLAWSPLLPSTSRLCRQCSCSGGHCEPEKEPQPQLHEPRSGAGAPGLEGGRL